MGEFASKALGGTALGLAIPGTVALVNQLGNGGLLGGLFGGGGGNQAQALMAENAMLKAELNTDAKIAARTRPTATKRTLWLTASSTSTSTRWLPKSPPCACVRLKPLVLSTA